MTNYKKASVVIANEICNMLFNNVIQEVGVESFLNWCEDGSEDFFGDYEDIDLEEVRKLMNKIAPYIDEASHILQQNMDEEYEIEESGITREQWKFGLNQFYYDCVNFWSTSFSLGEDDAMKLGIKDCLALNSWPFSPKTISMPSSIKEWYHGWLNEHSYYLEPISRAGVNKILAKLPNHEYWIKYKACDD